MSSISHRLLAIAAVFCAVEAVAQSAESDAPAVLIRRTSLLTPGDMVGAEVSPEVRVRLAIDERGEVTAVEPLSFAPSSEFDEALSEDIARQLGRWRFAPATRSGQPVASQVELAVQYRAVPESEVAVEAELQEDFFSGAAERRTAALLRLGFEERRRVIDRFALVAEKHLVRQRRRRADSPRFVVITDAHQEEVAEVLARNLEASYRQFFGLFGDHIEPQPERYKMVAYLFASRASYEAARLELRSPAGSDGFYAAPGFLAFHQEVIDPAELLARMIHESFHSFSDRVLRRPGGVLLPWLEEGLATYFGNSEIKRGRLVPGKVLRRKFLLHYGQVFKLHTEPGIGLAEIKRAVRQGVAPGPEEVLAATRQEFYGERTSLFYGTSWLLIHFLRHGEPEWSELQFPRLLLYLYEGYPAESVLAEVYGLAPEDMEGAFERYVRSF